jgi:hypothetical protein
MISYACCLCPGHETRGRKKNGMGPENGKG